jgi:hypothetical protein
MSEKEFNRVLEVYLTEGWMQSEEYEAMDDMQRYVVQAIKRARARIKRRNSEEKIYE